MTHKINNKDYSQNQSNQLNQRKEAVQRDIQVSPKALTQFIKNKRRWQRKIQIPPIKRENINKQK